MIASRGRLLVDSFVTPRSADRRAIAKQNARVQHLVRHAYSHSRFYRRHFDRAGVKPGDINGTRALSRVPIVQKEDLLAVPLADLMAGTDPASCRCHRTSGSSGVPLSVYYAPRDAARINASWLRPLSFHGIRPWHKRFEITGPHNITWQRTWSENLGLFRRQCASAFDTPAEWWASAVQADADYLWGYSGSLILFAKYCLENDLAPPSWRRVFGVSDLVDPITRGLIRAAFGIPLIDLYGAAEAGCVGWECGRCEGYHVNADTVVVQIEDDEQPSQGSGLGRIIITNLASSAMPIIRYDLGDIGALSSESPRCGCDLPLMRVVEGRSDAFVRLPSGRLLSPMFFFGVMKPVEGVSHWRVTQQGSGEVCIEVVLTNPIETTTLSAVECRVRLLLPEALPFAVAAVSAIEPERSGKKRAVVSLRPPTKSLAARV